jgi:O-antigen/teichoic acid export membrane protein
MAHRSVMSRARGAAGLTVANAAYIACGLVTGTIVARALGPEGRGTLAAILVPFYLAPTIVSLGLPVYLTRRAARQDRGPHALLTLALLALGAGALAFVVMIFLADVFAEGRDTVHEQLLIGFALMPLISLGYVLQGYALGQERWRLLAIARVAPGVLAIAGLAALAATDSLTVANAALVNFASALVVALMWIVGLRRERVGRASRAIAREAVAFGGKAWLGTLATVGNNRLDQVLMVTLVSARQLGLYVVAVSVASVSAIVVGALHSTMFPRVARGDREAVGFTLRLTLAIVAVTHLVLAAMTPFVLPALFGDDFRDAVPMVWLLLAAGIPGAGAFVMSGALTSAGHPGLSTAAEIVALVATVVGLIILLPPLGGVGAALVSLIAYSANLALQLSFSRRAFAIPTTQLLRPAAGDLRRVRLALADLRPA